MQLLGIFNNHLRNLGAELRGIKINKGHLRDEREALGTLKVKRPSPATARLSLILTTTDIITDIITDKITDKITDN